jgi:hypothetical protein
VVGSTGCGKQGVPGVSAFGTYQKEEYAILVREMIEIRV